MISTPVSTFTDKIDVLFWAIVILSAILLIGITITMIYFVIRYNYKRHPKASQIEGHTVLEIIWTIIPLIIVMTMFYYGYEGFQYMRDVPENSMVVKVTGRMWDWSFEYENGRKSDKLFVPVDKPVKLSMRSVDVNHSFFIPAFRIKEDVIPGRETYLWFKPQNIGPADVFCAEYCGQRHSYMLSEVIVMEQADFQEWYISPEDSAAAAAPPDPAPDLQQETAPAFTELMRENARKVLWDNGCFSCHTTDGSQNLGPSLRGIYSQKRWVVSQGSESEVIADREYLRLAVLEPDKELVRGFMSVVMPPAESLSEDELDLILDYLEHLK